MSWFRRGSGCSVRSEENMISGSPSPSQLGDGSSSERGFPGSGSCSSVGISSTSTPRQGSRSHGSSSTESTSPQASPIARRHLSMTTDPATCLEVFKTHWSQAKAIMTKSSTSSSSSSSSYGRRVAHEDAEAVIRYVDQMVFLLIEEQSVDGGQGPILEYLLAEDILEKLLLWCTQNVEHSDQLKLHQLRMYDLLISQSRQQVVLHKPIVRPLLKLLAMCKEHANPEVEQFLVIILHQLCVCIMQYKHLLELLFDVSPSHGPAKFLVFSLLIPYIHRQGDIGQQARDALLLIMSLSSVHDSVGQYIANQSDFCPVLATGLSGIYSSLPRKLDYPSDDWHQLLTDDIMHIPDLIMFLNSLDFCNAVVQVAHPLVQEQLLVFIYNGFLVPVLGPALHQTSMEEVIAATAYLELFLRRITEPALMQIFLKFILTAHHDDVSIIDSLIMRINSNSRLCMVTLSLFRTLIDLNCEDVMFQLIFKYLIPCNHVMVSQKRAVRDVDMYSKTAEKLLSLRPTCCQIEPDIPDTAYHHTADSNSLNSSSHQSSPSSSPVTRPSAHITPTSTPSSARKFKQFLLRRSPAVFNDYPASTNTAVTRSSSPDISDSCSHHSLGVSYAIQEHSTNGTQFDQIDRSYMEYLRVVRVQIEQCSRACQCWSLRYDGENPPSDCLVNGQLPAGFAQGKASADGVVSSAVPLTSSDSDTGENTASKHDSSLDSSSRSDNDCDTAIPQTTDHKTDEIGQRSDSAQSATSGVDSVLSASSCNRTECDDHALRGQDSPLSDNFSNTEFSAFLMSLKRVQTPVELNCSIEDSLSEIESVASRLKLSKTENKQNPVTSYQQANRESTTSVKNVTTESTKGCNPLTNGAVEDGQTPLEPISTSLDQKSKQITLNVITSGRRGDTSTPLVGPFLSTLFTRLEFMMQNTLYVNLLLTGVVTRLACYPQPLLRSFLLNHTLVFQPTVKSLIQVLSSVKQKVDCFALTVKNFDELLTKARQFLLWREEVYLYNRADLCNRKDRSSSSTGGSLLSQSSGIEPHKEKRNSIKELFKRNSNSKRIRADSRLQLLSDKKGFRYVNQKSPSFNTGHDAIADQLEALKTKNAVYCAIVLDEVLKELAAISQEHAVLCL